MYEYQVKKLEGVKKAKRGSGYDDEGRPKDWEAYEKALDSLRMNDDIARAKQELDMSLMLLENHVYKVNQLSNVPMGNLNEFHASLEQMEQYVSYARGLLGCAMNIEKEVRALKSAMNRAYKEFDKGEYGGHFD